MVGKMAQKVETRATNAADFSSILRAHVEERNNSHKLSCDCHTHAVTFKYAGAHVYTHTQVKCKKKAYSGRGIIYHNSF